MDAHKLAKLGSVLDHLSLADLQQVSNMVLERMKLRSPAAAAAAMASAAAAMTPPPVAPPPPPPVPPLTMMGLRRPGEFRVGDRVEFRHTKTGELIKGVVKQINAKSVSMIPDNRAVPWWRVGRGLLRHSAAAPAASPAPTMAPPAPTQPPAAPAFMPTAEGAGAW